MKKLMFAVVAMTACVGLCDGITSNNIVGYSQTPEVTKATFYISNSPFEGVGSSGTIKLADLLNTTAQPGKYDTMETTAPMVEFLKPSGFGYDYYYYISDAYDSEGQEVTGWADANGDLADVAVACGTAYWYRVPAEASALTIPGQVLNDDSVTKQVAKDQFNLLGNPYPIVFKFDKLSGTYLPGEYASMESSAPMIEVLKPSGFGYDYYYYISDAYDSQGQEVTGWADANGDLHTGDVTAIAQGFWMNLRGSKGSSESVTFAK